MRFTKATIFLLTACVLFASSPTGGANAASFTRDDPRGDTQIYDNELGVIPEPDVWPIDILSFKSTYKRDGRLTTRINFAKYKASSFSEILVGVDVNNDRIIDYFLVNNSEGASVYRGKLSERSRRVCSARFAKVDGSPAVVLSAASRCFKQPARVRTFAFSAAFLSTNGPGVVDYDDPSAFGYAFDDTLWTPRIAG